MQASADALSRQGHCMKQSPCRACAVDEYCVTDGDSTWTPQKPTLFDGHYLRNRSTLDIGVLGYIGIVQHK